MVYVITTIFKILVHIYSRCKPTAAYVHKHYCIYTEARYSSPLYSVRTSEYVQKHDTTAHCTELRTTEYV